MKFEKLRIKDIAKALGLSASTVSKALRGSYEISEPTQQLVRTYAATHGYQPNLLAQSLRKGKSKSVGVVVCNIDNNFFSQVIDGIESVAHQKDYNVIITQTHESYERELLSIQHLMASSVDGLIISLSAETSDISHIEQLHAKGLPVVFFDRVDASINTHKVTCDNFEGAYLATSHLATQGYQRIAHITSPTNLSITKERLAGYQKALEDHHLPAEEQYTCYCAHGGMLREEVEVAVRSLFSLPQPPDAIFAASDRLSITTYQILHSMHISIPADVAVIGFTNSSAAAIFGPPLSAVVQPAFEMGALAMEQLLQLVTSKQPVTTFETRVLAPQLIIRASAIKPALHKGAVL